MKKIDEKELIYIKEQLARQIAEYVSIIKIEYSDIISARTLNYLDRIKDFKDIIKIEQINTISMYVQNGIMYFPINAFSIIEYLKKTPGFGLNKKHKTYNKDTLLINDNNYLSYIKHVFIAGLTPLEFFEETLLHETTHLCGIGGGSALREGFAELKTRELAEKYNIKTSACGYPKEVKIAYELQNIFGKDICDKIAFAGSDFEIAKLLNENIGDDASKLYIEISENMEKIFQQYYSKEYKGIQGPITKTLEYDKIDYSNIYKLIAKYKNSVGKQL
jgi:hypothetical protein